jgi:hypothetical protein
MSDPANDAKWRAGSRIAEWASDGPIGVGSLMRSEDRGFKSKSSSFPAEFNFNLVAEGDGTLLTASGRIEFTGLFKLMEWLFGGRIKKQAEDDFERLKQLLEGG